MFWVKCCHLTGNLGVNMIDNASKVELYILLALLENVLLWNQTALITKYQWVK